MEIVRNTCLQTPQLNAPTLSDQTFNTVPGRTIAREKRIARYTDKYAQKAKK